MSRSEGKLKFKKVLTKGTVKEALVENIDAFMERCLICVLNVKTHG